MAVTREKSVIPDMTMDMFGTDPRMVASANRLLRDFYGRQTYAQFKNALRVGEEIPQEARIAVDRQIIDKVVGLERENVWYEAMRLAHTTVDKARGILFPGQDKRGTITNEVRGSDNRPSTILSVFAAPVDQISPVYRFDQGRAMVLGRLALELLVHPDHGKVGPILEQIDQHLGRCFFVGPQGPSGEHHSIVTSHEPGTNKLIDIQRADSPYLQTDGVWIRALSYPVRMVGLGNNNGGISTTVKSYVEYDEKNMEASVIKAQQRSLKSEDSDLIEATPHVRDRARFRVVVMEGGRGKREEVTDDLKRVLEGCDGVKHVENDDLLHPKLGDAKRPSFRKMLVFHSDLLNPIEVQVFTLLDYIGYEFEAGNWSDKLWLHNGPNHDHHKLGMVGDIAESWWPTPLHKINLRDVQRRASYEIAEFLGKRMRIHPDPYAA